MGPSTSITALKERSSLRSTQVYAFLFKTEEQLDGSQKKVCYWDVRRPVNLPHGERYKCFSSIDAFNEYCRMNNIHTRSKDNL